MEFTHFNEEGNARMVNISSKDITHRTAVARGTIHVTDEIMDAILGQKIVKGDVLTVAQVAGIMAVKKTGDTIPLCHTLLITGADIRFEVRRDAKEIDVWCSVENDGKTGVEMEALFGASTALLTIYDMCKAIDKGMVISDVRLVSKSGGKNGYVEESDEGCI